MPEQVEPVRVPVAHLRDDQLALVRSVLRAGDVPVAVVEGELLTGANFIGEVEEAIAWVLAADGPPPDDDDPSLSSGRGPVVKPSRPVLADGRREATRWRRFAAGMIDEVLISVPVLMSLAAGAALWVAVAVQFVARVLPVATYGWTLGKLWCGLRVVHRRTLRRPGLVDAVLRWLVTAVPLFVGMLTVAVADVMTLIAMVVYAPILWDLRGLHDRAAGTLVVERSPAR